MFKSLNAIDYFLQKQNKTIILEPKEKREILFLYYLSLVRS